MSEKIKSKFESRTDCRICENCKRSEQLNNDGIVGYEIDCSMIQKIIWLAVDQVNDGCCQFFREVTE